MFPSFLSGCPRLLTIGRCTWGGDMEEAEHVELTSWFVKDVDTREEWLPLIVSVSLVCERSWWTW